MSAWQPPRPARLLWRVWYRLSRWEGRLWDCAMGRRDPLTLDTDAGLAARALSWWYWDGPGRLLMARESGAERRWQRVRYARQTRGRRGND